MHFILWRHRITANEQRGNQVGSTGSQFDAALTALRGDEPRENLELDIIVILKEFGFFRNVLVSLCLHC